MITKISSNDNTVSLVNNGCYTNVKNSPKGPIGVMRTTITNYGRIDFFINNEFNCKG